MSKKNILLLVLSVIIWLAIFLFIDPQKYIATLSSFNKFFLGIILLSLLFDLFLRISRWWILLLSQEQKLPFKALVYPMFSAILINLLLPGRVGDLIRLQALKDPYDVSYSAGLSVIVVEQVINLLGLVLVVSFSFGLIIIQGIQLNSTIITYLIPVAFLISIIVVFGISLIFIVDVKKFFFLFRIFPTKIQIRISRLLTTFDFGLKTIKKQKRIFWIALAFSVTIWTLEGIDIWLISLSLINKNFEFAIALCASAIGNLNFLFPILPGAIGLYEGFVSVILTLSPYYQNSKSVSVAFTDRVIKTALLGILGSYSLSKLGSDTLALIRRKDSNEQIIEEAEKEISS